MDHIIMKGKQAAQEQEKNLYHICPPNTINTMVISAHPDRTVASPTPQ